MPLLSQDILSDGKRPIIDNVWVGDAKYKLAPNETPKDDQHRLLNMRGKSVRGLLDTGASCTAISAKLAQELRLDSAGITAMDSASQRETQTAFYEIAVQIKQRVVNKNISATGDDEFINVSDKSLSEVYFIRAIEFVGANDYDVLIGMDVISSGLLIVSGFDKKITISF